jgi:hypothetical protein
MLSESQIVTLLMNNHTYFNSEEYCSLYSDEELQHILIQLNKLEEKYFKRIMELRNDPDEKSEKITGRRVIENAHHQISYYLNYHNMKKNPVIKTINYNWIFGLIFYLCLFSFCLYFIIR